MTGNRAPENAGFRGWPGSFTQARVQDRLSFPISFRNRACGPFGGRVSRDGMVGHTRSRLLEHGGGRGDDFRTVEFVRPIGMLNPYMIRTSDP